MPGCQGELPPCGRKGRSAGLAESPTGAWPTYFGLPECLGALRYRALQLACLGLVLLASTAACDARVPPTCARLRPQDEIWLVSSRELTTRLPYGCLCRPQLAYQQYTVCGSCGCGRWRGRTECAFWGTDDPCRLTVVYVHGNRMTEEWVRRRGLDLYNGLVGGGQQAPPIRLVLWSWPSKSIPNRLAAKRDARVKFRRIPLQAYYLAWWLNHYSSDRQLSLVGYSYGAATVLGSLHILGGGQLEYRRLARCEPLPRMRVTIWAPAVQSSWLTPGGRLGCALPCVESGLVFYNRCDPALCRFDRVIFTASGPALGYVGLTHPPCGDPECARIRQFDATPYVGRRHDWDRYRKCPCLMSQIRCAALWLAN